MGKTWKKRWLYKHSAIAKRRAANAAPAEAATTTPVETVSTEQVEPAPKTPVVEAPAQKTRERVLETPKKVQRTTKGTTSKRTK